MYQVIHSGSRTPRRRSVVLLRQQALLMSPEELCLRLCSRLLNHTLSHIAISVRLELDVRSHVKILRNLAKRMFLMYSPSGVSAVTLLRSGYSAEAPSRAHYHSAVLRCIAALPLRGYVLVAVLLGVTAQPCGLRSPRTFLRFCSKPTIGYR